MCLNPGNQWASKRFTRKYQASIYWNDTFVFWRKYTWKKMETNNIWHLFLPCNYSGTLNFCFLVETRKCIMLKNKLKSRNYMKASKWHCKVLRPHSGSEAKFSPSGWLVCTSLTSAAHSFASQLYSDLRDTITWINARGQIQKHKIDLLSYASVPNLLPSRPYSWNRWSHISIISGLFLLFLLCT